MAPHEKRNNFFQNVAHDLVSNVNHSPSSKLFGKSILVQTHLNIISLSEVSVQAPHIIPVISVLSCIICIHPDETGEVLCVQMNFKQPQHIIIQCRFPAALSWHPAAFCGPPFHSLPGLHLITTRAHPCLWAATAAEIAVQNTGLSSCLFPTSCPLAAVLSQRSLLAGTNIHHCFLLECVILGKQKENYWCLLEN